MADIPEEVKIKRRLASDLQATRSWIETNTYVASTQSSWYQPSRSWMAHRRRKCERCKILRRLDRQILDADMSSLTMMSVELVRLRAET